MNARLRGALVGALIGAGIGALYGFAFVAYRERMKEAGQQLEQRVEVRAPNGQLVSPEVSDPERVLSPAAMRLKELNARARQIAQSEGIRYQDAQRRAAEERAQERRQQQEEA